MQGKQVTGSTLEQTRAADHDVERGEQEVQEVQEQVKVGAREDPKVQDRNGIDKEQVELQGEQVAGSALEQERAADHDVETGE